MIEMRSYLTAVTDAVAANNHPAASVASGEALSIIAERGLDGIMLDGMLPPNPNDPDPTLRDAWTKLWGPIVDLLKAVHDLTRPIVAVPAIPA